ncbi:MAG: hypothetical protein JKY37_15010 [Nannocystaceae bacterium]|nr:hypothetical protein [Nannocystaceae bacterium]
MRYEGSEAGSCEQAAQALAAAWIDAALAAELTHDGVCSLIGPWTYCDEINYDSATRCQIYSGAGGLGEACEAFGPYMSSCARDLACGVDDICYDAVDLPIEGALGHRCGIPLGDYTECAPELACVEGRCVTAAAADGGCDDERPCGDTYWCDEGLCAREANVSKPCTTDEGCYSGMCEDGSCLIEQPRGCRGFFW